MKLPEIIPKRLGHDRIIVNEDYITNRKAKMQDKLEQLYLSRLKKQKYKRNWGPTLDKDYEKLPLNSKLYHYSNRANQNIISSPLRDLK